MKFKTAIKDAKHIGVAAAARKHKMPYRALYYLVVKNKIKVPKHRRGHEVELAVLQAMFPGVPLTREHIAKVCGITRERVRQIEMQALRKIRNKLLKDQGLSKELRESQKD